MGVLLADASRVAADALSALGANLQAGGSGAELDELLYRFLSARNATAAPLHYGGFTGALMQPTKSKIGRAICGAFDGGIGFLRQHFVPALPAMPLCGFPGHLCFSVNSEVCHGTPRSTPKLQMGDLVKLDVAVKLEGVIGDTCATFIVGGEDASDPESLRLANVAREALFLGIITAGANRTLGDIGHAVQTHIEKEGFTVVTAFGGHGVGRQFHEPPHVNHVGKPGEGHRLTLGQVLTIEPIVAAGSELITILGDGWTAVTRDGKHAAQWEHTVVIENEEGPARVLTARVGETLPERIANRTERDRIFQRYSPSFATLLSESTERLLYAWPSLFNGSHSAVSN